jgi:hypothetical protein
VAPFLRVAVQTPRAEKLIADSAAGTRVDRVVGLVLRPWTGAPEAEPVLAGLSRERIQERRVRCRCADRDESHVHVEPVSHPDDVPEPAPVLLDAVGRRLPRRATPSSGAAPVASWWPRQRGRSTPAARTPRACRSGRAARGRRCQARPCRRRRRGRSGRWEARAKPAGTSARAGTVRPSARLSARREFVSASPASGAGRARRRRREPRGARFPRAVSTGGLP